MGYDKILLLILSVKAEDASKSDHVGVTVHTYTNTLKNALIGPVSDANLFLYRE